MINKIEKGIKRKIDYWTNINRNHEYLSGLKKALEYVQYEKAKSTSSKNTDSGK